MGFKNAVNGSLIYFTCKLLDHPGVTGCFTTRLGGVSTGNLSSLNLGLTRGDNPKNVEENYRILGKTFGFSPESAVGFPQVHGDDVCHVTQAHRGIFYSNPDKLSYDAMVTDAPGLPLFVYTADCVPILLYDAAKKAIGAVHAGWRGTAKGLVKKTVLEMSRLFGSRPEDIRAAIGPSIGQCCFETDDDVPWAIVAAIGNDADNFFRPWGKKWHVDLKGINRYWLMQCGLASESIETSDACTACAPDLFWSHRKHGDQRGTLAAFIMLR